jgi:tetratricopeptide (TPR) repeat protein
VHLLIVGATANERTRAAHASIAGARGIVACGARTLPFARIRDVALPPEPRTVLIDTIEDAFPHNQTGSTRLVLTQSLYLVQTLVDRLGANDRIVATADRAALNQCAPEALQLRGPWSAFEVEDLSRGFGPADGGSPSPTPSAARMTVGPVEERLAHTYRTRDAAERRTICREVTDRFPDVPVAWLALASAYREHQDLGARDALERAATLAPDWEAVHYELGKLWLVLDDMPRARDAFRRAADLMPSFSLAFSNLGATLGELDDPEAALAAFRQALASDRGSHVILSNIGVVSRELGRLDESEAALRQVVALAPEFVFGHYNLGHTLFFARRYQDAVAAYEEGLRRDPQRSPRQSGRLAMARLAAGDASGAERELRAAVSRAPAGDREDLLAEAYEIAQALLAAHPELAAHRSLVDRLAAEISKSE